jgi:hypothetical protein
MAKFLFIYRGAGEHLRTMSPEQLQAHNQKWVDWISEGMRKGWMLDPGDGLTNEGRVVNSKVVTDGPFAESKEMIGGYTIVDAETVDDAAKLAKGCPGLLVGATVEVRRLAGYTEQMKSSP